MEQNTHPQDAPSTADVPSQPSRPRWSSPPAASKSYRPSLSLISRAKSHQKPLGLSWMGLIR